MRELNFNNKLIAKKLRLINLKKWFSKNKFKLRVAIRN